MSTGPKSEPNVSKGGRRGAQEQPKWIQQPVSGRYLDDWAPKGNKYERKVPKKDGVLDAVLVQFCMRAAQKICAKNDAE